MGRDKGIQATGRRGEPEDPREGNRCTNNGSE